jgi:hypothetical protein
MSGPKRNPDRLNTIGVVVVGICGAVLVYVTIVALEAFYVNDTSEIQTMADYGGQDTGVRSMRTEQVNRIAEWGTNPKPAAPKAGEAPRQQSYRIPIDVAMKLVVEGAKAQPDKLVPVIGPSDKATVMPIFGRPKLAPAAPAAPAAAPSGTGAAAPAPGAAPAAPGGAGSGSAAELPAAPQVPTGAGTGPQPVGGAGALDKPPTPGTPGAGAPPAKAPAPAAGSAAAPPKGNAK